MKTVKNDLIKLIAVAAAGVIAGTGVTAAAINAASNKKDTASTATSVSLLERTCAAADCGAVGFCPPGCPIRCRRRRLLAISASPWQTLRVISPEGYGWLSPYTNTIERWGCEMKNWACSKYMADETKKCMKRSGELSHSSSNERITQISAKGSISLSICLNPIQVRMLLSTMAISTITGDKVSHIL